MSITLPFFSAIGVYTDQNFNEIKQELKTQGFSSGLLLSQSPLTADTFFKQAQPCLDENLEITDFSQLETPFIYSPNYLNAPDSKTLYQVLIKAKLHEVTYLSSPADHHFLNHGDMHEGEISFKLGLRGISPLAEELIISRDIEFSRNTGCAIHFLYISSARSLHLIKLAKKEGLPITVGVKLENLIYTEKDCDSFNSDFKYYPPLRTKEDLMALQSGARHGDIDIITLGMITKPVADNDQCFQASPFRSLDVKDFIANLMTHLLKQEILSQKDIERLLCTNPKKIFQLQEESQSHIKINPTTNQIHFKEGPCAS